MLVMVEPAWIKIMVEGEATIYLQEFDLLE